MRPESRAEAEAVAAICAERGIEHTVLTVEVGPGNVQASAREARYAALGRWARGAGIAKVATAHHRDDQAETVLMRLNRGSGVAGLAGIRPYSWRAADGITIVRPLLGWSKAELETIVVAAGIEAARDPSNDLETFDRVRMRKALEHAPWLNREAIARSASALADAEEALEWAARREWDERVEREGDGFGYTPHAMREIRLRILKRSIAELGGTVRGSAIADLDRSLMRGEGGTLGGVQFGTRGGLWSIRREPPRRTG